MILEDFLNVSWPSRRYVTIVNRDLCRVTDPHIFQDSIIKEV